MLRDPKLQKKAIDYALDKLNPAIQNVGSQALNQLSTKIRPNKKYTTNRKDLDGAGVIGDILGPTKTVSNITGKIAGKATKKTLDDWWSGALAKRAFSPKTGIFSGHSGPAAIDKNGNVIDLKFGVYKGKLWMFRKDNGQPFGPATKGGALDIQKQLAKLGEIHLRTPTGKKYNYCGPGTKLEEQISFK